jgi:hypothetical protein
MTSSIERGSCQINKLKTISPRLKKILLHESSSNKNAMDLFHTGHVIFAISPSITAWLYALARYLITPLFSF